MNVSPRINECQLQRIDYPRARVTLSTEVPQDGVSQCISRPEIFSESLIAILVSPPVYEFAQAACCILQLPPTSKRLHRPPPSRGREGLIPDWLQSSTSLLWNVFVSTRGLRRSPPTFAAFRGSVEGPLKHPRPGAGRAELGPGTVTGSKFISEYGISRASCDTSDESAPNKYHA